MAGFEVGAAVEIYGLLKSGDLNGQIGTLSLYDSDADRWAVDLPGGIKKVRTINLRAHSVAKQSAGEEFQKFFIAAKGRQNAQQCPEDDEDKEVVSCAVDLERAKCLKDLGNAAVKHGWWSRAQSLYLSADAIADRALRITLASNLSLVALKLADPVRAAEFATKGIALGATGLLATKLQHRLDAANIMNDTLLNYQASLGISKSRPTRFTPRLASAVYSQSVAFFATGTFAKVGQCNFLATINVGPCIVIFAWSKRCDVAIGFGAHVPLGAVLHGCIRCFQGSGSQHVLQELVDALKSAFTGISPTDVEIHILGGHAYEETNAESSLKLAFFRNEPEKQRFSWHVKDAVRAAGLRGASINSAMANVFEGGKISAETAKQFLKENQHFFCAALHMETGNIVTHTEFESALVELESAQVVPRMVPTEWLALQKAKGMEGMTPMRDVDG